MIAAEVSQLLLRRALWLQITFVMGVTCASRLGTSSLAAHQVIAQLWLLTSYVVDGFAAAGTVLGSRLGAMRSDPAALRYAIWHQCPGNYHISLSTLYYWTHN